MSNIFVLSGAGLSAASGIPTFRDKDGLWEGHDVVEVATPEGWARNPVLVRRFYDERRVQGGAVQPNAGHFALARLQDALGPGRVSLVTQNIDGLLQKAGCREVIEMHGSIWRLRCERREEHPTVPVSGVQDPAARCDVCQAPLRPAVVWFGEIPHHMERIQRDVLHASIFLSVGTSGVVYPAAGFVATASRLGATCIEVNPAPAGGPFSRVIREGSEIALPRLVEELIAEGLEN